MSKFSTRCLSAILASFILSSCGGGGGGSGTFGAANVNLQVDPATIDTADRMQVKVELYDIHENGIALKIRFPEELAYVAGTAYIELNDDEEIDITPAVNATSTDGDTYLVFYLNIDDFDDEEEGNVVVELVGKKAIDDGLISIDADIDDPDISNDVEFNIEEPNFESEADKNIRVKG